MITHKNNRTVTTEPAGNGTMAMEKLLTPPHQAAKLRTFADITLEPGAAVSYHIHTGESESYYILSGSGLYNDNGQTTPVAAGDVTFTPNGTGHGLENTGSEPLRFIALIILD